MAGELHGLVGVQAAKNLEAQFLDLAFELVDVSIEVE